jgi:NAD(P)H-dependent flavin oxidoreductase YrpB (nitropropane dioxygenase family)
MLAVRPPVVLIAGGRPSQARPLEAVGIQTWLHVPSPGLLDLYLKDGARRFIFEGRECGGHVGPRASFPLWEQQISRLLASPALDEVSVLFAGGIHDARSAAMVAAMAAPLSARGAKIGVLMGTAYLFTEEAVSAGAIEPEFQTQALRCEQTVLLETAPGHATRCAETEFVRAFRAERRRLEAEGLRPKRSGSAWRS